MASPAVNLLISSKFDNKGIASAKKQIAAMEKQLKSPMQKFNDFGKQMQGFGDSMAKVGGSMTKSLTLPIVGVGAAALATAAEFEKSMNKVSAISGATGGDFDALSEQAKELGRTTQYSAAQAADAMSFLAMAGFSADEIMGAMPGTLSLAAAGQLDLAEAADIASNILTGYNKAVDELPQAMDVLAKTFTSTNTDLTQLGEAFKYAGPVASTAGVDFEEAAAAIGLMGNAGIQGSMAGTSLRGAISRLLDPTERVANRLHDLGVVVTDTNGTLLPLNEIIGQLADSGATTADFMAIFGQRAGPAMAALVQQGQDALISLTGELENAGGTADRIAKTQMQGLSGALTRLKSAFEGAMIAIAESGLLERATVLVERLAVGFGEFAAWMSKLPEPVTNTIMVVAGLAAALGPVLLIVGKVVSAVGGIIAVFNPVGAIIVGVIAAVAALAAIFVLMWNRSETLRNAIKDAFERIKAVVMEVIDNVKAKIEENRETLEDLRTAFMAVVDFIADYVIPIIVEFYSQYLSVLIKVIGWLIERIVDWIAMWVQVIKKIAEVVTAVYNFASEAGEAVGSWVRSMVATFQNGFNAVRDFITNVFTSIYDTITGTIKRAVNVVVDGINAIINAWNGLSFDIPAFTVGIGALSKTFGPYSISTPNIPNVPKLAEGGIVTAPTLALIGEAGPEAVVPLSNGGGYGGNTYNITVQAGMGTDGAEVGRQVVEAIRSYERRSGKVFAAA